MRRRDDDTGSRESGYGPVSVLMSLIGDEGRRRERGTEESVLRKEERTRGQGESDKGDG
jgi:hypothetical protein